MAGYVDIYLLPVPKDNIDAYREQAQAFGAVAKEHGAIRYREFKADDLGEGFTAATPDGNLLTAAVVDFESREHRDEVMGKVMKDERVKAMGESGDEVADMSHMRYGGFETFVEA
jgi:uncharacterized protein YbaA (DUF1428 family)